MKTIVTLIFALFLTACGSSGPDKEQVESYLNHRLPSSLNVKNFDFKTFSQEGGGRISVSGTLVFTDNLYSENRGYRNKIHSELYKNGFTEKEVKHWIYKNIIKDYTKGITPTLLEHEKGDTILFRGELIYQENVDGYSFVDGFTSSLEYQRPKGDFLRKFDNPTDGEGLAVLILERAKKEKEKYLNLAEEQKQALSKIWDNDHGIILSQYFNLHKHSSSYSYNRVKKALADTEGKNIPILHIKNIKPLDFKSAPNSKRLYSIGTMETTGTAVCLDQFALSRSIDPNYRTKTCTPGREMPIKVSVKYEVNDKSKDRKKFPFYTTARFQITRETIKKNYSNTFPSNTVYFYDNKMQGSQKTHGNPPFTTVHQLTVLEKPYARKEQSGESEKNDGKEIEKKIPIPTTSAGTTQNNTVVSTENPRQEQQHKSEEIEQIPTLEPVTAIPEKPSYSRAQVRSIQNSLRSRGYYHGAIDGLYGKQTARAISAYQQDRGLHVTGTPSVDLENDLYRNRQTQRQAQSPRSGNQTLGQRVGGVIDRFIDEVKKGVKQGSQQHSQEY